MTPNPVLGVLFHWLGGLASGSFYVPYRGVKTWAWETYWLTGGFFSWIIMPWLMALLLTNDVIQVLCEASASTWFWAYLFGVLWGVGNATFGLTMRYLGMSLGMAVALGYCAAFGTLMPPIFNGTFVSQVLGATSGQVVLFGIVICLTGIGLAGLAGMSKERELPEAEKQAVIKEFSLKKGLMVATVSGILSACFSYGLAAGDPIKELTLRHGTGVIWQGLPVLIVVLLGGFTTNFTWCVILNVRNKTGYQYLSPMTRPAPANPEQKPAPAPMLANYIFCAMAGITWYLQFFFYSMGETQMGAYKFSSWTLHMASIIIFSTLWGIALHEWRGSSRRTRGLVTASIVILVLSTVVVGYGNYLGSSGPAH